MLLKTSWGWRMSLGNPNPTDRTKGHVLKRKLPGEITKSKTCARYYFTNHRPGILNTVRNYARPNEAVLSELPNTYMLFRTEQPSRAHLWESVRPSEVSFRAVGPA